MPSHLPGTCPPSVQGRLLVQQASRPLQDRCPLYKGGPLYSKHRLEEVPLSSSFVEFICRVPFSSSFVEFLCRVRLSSSLVEFIGRVHLSSLLCPLPSAQGRLLVQQASRPLQDRCPLYKGGPLYSRHRGPLTSPGPLFH